MIEKIKEILQKLKEGNYTFSPYLASAVYTKNTETRIYGINFKIKNSKFSISPRDCALHLFKDNYTVETIKCSDKDFNDIIALTSELNSIYRKKAINEFMNL